MGTGLLSTIPPGPAPHRPAPADPTVKNPDSRPYPDNRLQPLVGLGQVRHSRPGEGRRAVSLCASRALGFRSRLPEAHGLATAPHGPVHRPLTLSPPPPPAPPSLWPGRGSLCPSSPLPLLPPSFPLIPHRPASLGDPLPQACPGPMPRWNPSGL